MNALRNTQPRLLAYLSYMVERLVQMKIIMKPTGSIYLHCDPTASHYIKVMMDGIFGHQNFRSETIWKRTSGHSDSKLSVRFTIQSCITQKQTNLPTISNIFSMRNPI